MVKHSITAWDNQYSYTLDLNGDKEYAINFNQFTASNSNTAINANDITAVNFSFINSRGVATNVTASVSNARFSKAQTTTLNTDVTLGVSPNPNTGNFTASFNSTVNESVLLKVVEISTGKVVYTQVHTATKGNNVVKVNMTNKVATTNGLYLVTLTSDSNSYKPVKLMVNR